MIAQYLKLILVDGCAVYGFGRGCGRRRCRRCIGRLAIGAIGAIGGIAIGAIGGMNGGILGSGIAIVEEALVVMRPAQTREFHILEALIVQVELGLDRSDADLGPVRALLARHVGEQLAVFGELGRRERGRAVLGELVRVEELDRLGVQRFLLIQHASSRYETKQKLFSLLTLHLFHQQHFTNIHIPTLTKVN